MLPSSWRFPPFVTLRLFFILLLGGATLFASWAHSDAEPMEPLPVALPAGHPPVAPSGGYVGAQSCAECHATEYRHW